MSSIKALKGARQVPWSWRQENSSWWLPSTITLENPKFFAQNRAGRMAKKNFESRNVADEREGSTTVLMTDFLESENYIQSACFVFSKIKMLAVVWKRGERWRWYIKKKNAWCGFYLLKGHYRLDDMTL